MKFIKLKVIGPQVVTINIDDISYLTKKKIVMNNNSAFEFIKDEDRQRFEIAMIELGNGDGCFLELAENPD